MKTMLLAFAAMVVLCSYLPFETIKGDGNVKKENREVATFSSVSLNGSMNVELNYGSTSGIIVEADENLLPYLITEVENGVLTIKTKDKVNLRTGNSIVIYASMTSISALKVSGSGSIRGKGNFYSEGEGSFSISGSGNIKMEVGSFKEANIKVSGSGDVVLKGKRSNKILAAVSGSGNIDCSNLPASDVDAAISGSGDIKIKADKKINAKVSGSGNIYYSGDAKNVSFKSVGSGKLIKE